MEICLSALLKVSSRSCCCFLCKIDTLIYWVFCW